MRGIGIVRAVGVLALAVCVAGRAAERINQEGRILGPAPVVTTPVIFNTPAADTIISAMQIYPVTSAWNEDVSKLPLLTNSGLMIAKINSDLASSRRTLRMFGEMNYILVPDNEPKQDVLFFNYPDESDDLKPGSQDTGTYPIDTNLPIEGWPSETGSLTLAQWQQDINNDGGDRHSITVMPGAGFVWETWLTQALPNQTPVWNASNGAKFDLKSNTLRPPGFTSGDAAGLSMFGALVRYDECERGMVEHAVRLVVKTSRSAHIYPATHDAGSTSDVNTPAMGQRIRLNAGFTIPSSWTKEEKAVALALKKYGGIVADNGGFFSISYCPDDRFPAGCFDHLSTISVGSFEVVQSTGATGGPRLTNPVVVNAGTDQTVILSAGATLSGSVTGGTSPTILWYAYPYTTQPGTVTFSNAASLTPTATFSAPGTYILMLSGDDGVHAKTFDAVNITVMNTANNPAPTLTTLAPATAKTGGAGFTLTLTGTNFNSASVVNWAGQGDLAPATVTATTITVNVPPAYIATAGSIAVTVTNPTPGGGVSAAKTFSVSNPAPTLASISPVAASVGSAAFTLTVNGTNFMAGSVVNWAGHSDLIPTSVTPTQFTVKVPASYVAAAGTFAVTVTNPAPGGGVSAAQNFAVQNPVPTLASIAPTSALAGGVAFTLTLTGTNFVASAVVNWPGHAALTPVTNTGTTITVSVPATYIATAASVAVTVTNPAPGGGASPSKTFSVINPNPVPTLATIAPISAIAGVASFTLTLNGTNFIAASVVNWPGHADLTPVTNTGTQITVNVPSAYVASVGTAAITVTNPAPGGGTSSAQTFTIAPNPAPTLSGISPASATAGGASFTLTLTGTNFIATSVVNWAGHADLVPVTKTGTQLTVNVPVAYIASAGTPAVTVTNPAPGGGTSSAQTFTINAVVTNPVPTLSGITPASATAGGATFTLTLTGTNFIGASVVKWAGHADLTPASVTATQIMVNVPSAYITSVGTPAITVMNPAPGGGTSLAQTFTINAFVTNPVPILNGITPPTAIAGSGAFTLTLTGTNFIAASVVKWAGQADLTPVTVTATQLTVNVPATYVASVGSAAITIANPAPGGGSSSATPFAIVNTTGSFLSGPTVDNDTPVVGETVHFSATPPGTNAFAFTWNFGDGTSDTSGASVSHAYATAGSYMVQVVAVDPLGNSVQGSLNVTVTDAGMPPVPMTISKFVAAIKAKAPGGDMCSFSGVLPNLPTPFSPAGPLVLNINGVVATLTLDTRGRQTGVNSFAFKLKALPRVRGVKTTSYQGGSVPFKVTLRKGNFASAWGIPATGGKGVPIPLKIDVQYAGLTYEANITSLYKGAAGKNGTLKK